MGCDEELREQADAETLFQSTHPVWDATRSGPMRGSTGWHFNPRIPYGMRPPTTPPTFPVTAISIHASRMGCDAVVARGVALSGDFNPRIPYGMRPAQVWRNRHHSAISIHASRMGCDDNLYLHETDNADFNPRIPYGMRHDGAYRFHDGRAISIHASRMGCDAGRPRSGHPTGRFQSTHPVWDATDTIKRIRC